MLVLGVEWGLLHTAQAQVHWACSRPRTRMASSPSALATASGHKGTTSGLLNSPSSGLVNAIENRHRWCEGRIHHGRDFRGGPGPSSCVLSACPLPG